MNTLRARSRRRQSYRRGHWAEYLAAGFLFLKGYRIVKRRYKTAQGEIDLIARKGRVLVAVEVKNRSSLAAALESITPRNRQRVEAAARHYLAGQPAGFSQDVRFDVIAVGWPFGVRHLDNAWRAGS